ncbi:hypothetical protein [Brevibacillus reuszeri]|uniref:hypothetical protein n=1 Tax=Brevibacillus reuszeri TaxID=54915 RepID=UPI0035B4FFBF
MENKGYKRNFVYSLEKTGVETEQISSEYGPGQLEINLKYARALKAADEKNPKKLGSFIVVFST